jgi:hypothetical protein
MAKQHLCSTNSPSSMVQTKVGQSFFLRFFHSSVSTRSSIYVQVSPVAPMLKVGQGFFLRFFRSSVSARSSIYVQVSPVAPMLKLGQSFFLRFFHSSVSTRSSIYVQVSPVAPMLQSENYFETTRMWHAHVRTFLSGRRKHTRLGLNAA